MRKVHIRYEDGQTNSSGFPFAAGATLQEVTMKTTNSDEPDDGKIKLKIFEKQVLGYFFSLINLSLSSHDCVSPQLGKARQLCNLLEAKSQFIF